MDLVARRRQHRPKPKQQIWSVNQFIIHYCPYKQVNIKIRFYIIVLSSISLFYHIKYFSFYWNLQSNIVKIFRVIILNISHGRVKLYLIKSNVPQNIKKSIGPHEYVQLRKIILIGIILNIFYWQMQPKCIKRDLKSCSLLEKHNINTRASTNITYKLIIFIYVCVMLYA